MESASIYAKSILRDGSICGRLAYSIAILSDYFEPQPSARVEILSYHVDRLLEARVPYHLLGCLQQGDAQSCNQSTPFKPWSLGLLGEALLHAKSIYDAWLTIVRYEILCHGMGTTVICEKSGLLIAEFSSDQPSNPAYQLFARLWIGLFQSACLWLSWDAELNSQIKFDFSNKRYRIELDRVDAGKELPQFNQPRVLLYSRLLDTALTNLTVDRYAFRARQVIHQEIIAGNPVSLPLVASKLCCSVSALKKKLQAENISYSELLASVRMDCACFYLSEMEFTVQDVSSILGFQDVSSFSRNFKQWVGLTPRAYRTNIQMAFE